MSYPSVILADTPIGYWRFGESAGTAADNAEGTTARDGTYTGSYSLGQTGPVVGGGSALLTGGYIEVADNAAMHPGDVFSFEFWWKRTTTGTQQVFFGPGVTNEIYLFSNIGDSLVMWQGDVGSIYETYDALTDTASWHHIVYTKNGSAIHVWLDGSDMPGASSNKTIIPNTGSGNPLFAVDGGAAPTRGYVSETAIYNYALTSGQVAAHYAARTSDLRQQRFIFG